MNFKIDRGTPLPHGATKGVSGYNFSLFSKHAATVAICLYNPDNKTDFQEIPFDRKFNKTGDLWHIFIYDLPAHYYYGYRIEGLYEPLKGLYFDSRHIVLDPYARAIQSSSVWGEEHYSKNILLGVVDPLYEKFNWENDTHPNHHLRELIIYEMHVRGFTQDSSSKVAEKGTFLGMLEKIPYLKSLGINAVELMPVFEFNECEINKINLSNERLYNYWGYSSINFFSLMNRYGTSREKTILEFKSLIKELHANDIEVILDVVYNHTAEGNAQGPTFSFKGIENSSYYLLGPNGEYYNFSGCGNTINANHPVVREIIRDSLRYWVQEMHIDGFRFDLASILTRSHDGIPLASPPLIEALSFDPLLANTKLIAEAWDAGGLYQVGSFPSWGKWAEWNGKFRDDVRNFIKGTDGSIGPFATRICGSQDLYAKGRQPYHSINFVTSHDGFSLYDLVSYNEKHNESNGEDNRDGDNNNCSWNCGVEGETKNKKILFLRHRQMRNFILALLISQGVPMILMGDEYAHTKQGNNNTWCHDDPINWFQWEQLEKNQDLFRFMTSMIAFRKKHPILYHSRFLNPSDIIWHGIIPDQPDWSITSRFIAFTLVNPVDEFDIYVAFNTSNNSVEISFPTPSTQGQYWHRIIDTSKKSPEDFVEEENTKPLSHLKYTLNAYSSIMLKSKITP